ncbi:MAG TPA: hypothetical protein VHT52_24730, partial [Stellaceae bacterium]|nr:hypothetical protein [Stellaceae bacterium]
DAVMHFRIKPEYAARIAWGLPDSPVRPFCALCHRYIDDEAVPFRLFKDDGSGASFCDECRDDMLVLVA